MKKIHAWERRWRAAWTEALRSGAGPLSNAAAVAGKRIKAANDDKYIGA